MWNPQLPPPMHTSHPSARDPAVRCVKRVYTDLAIIDITPAGMVVREMLGDLSEEELRARTGAPLTFAPDCRPLVAPAIALPD